MARYWRRLIPAVGMFCSLLILSGLTGKGPRAASEDRSPSSGFRLPHMPKSALTPAEQKGQSLYEYYCVLCHGKTGKGDGFNSYNLTRSPKNFTDQAQMEALSDSQIERAILEGGRGLGLSPQMPAWGGVLSDKQASELMAFIRTLAKQDGGKK